MLNEKVEIANMRTQGDFDPNNGKIRLNKNLDHKTWSSKQLVLNHELFHKKIHKDKIKLSLAQEEIKADIYSLMKTNNKHLSTLEALLKRYIIKKNNGKKLTIKQILEMNEFI